MIWSEWHNVRSDGTIPEDLLPADLFQLRYFVEWDYGVVNPSTMYALLTGKWRWDIRDSAGGLLFEQANQVRVMVVWLNLLGSINMVSWNWDPSGDSIETTYPDPAPTMGGMAESLYLDPASNAGLGPMTDEEREQIEAWEQAIAEIRAQADREDRELTEEEREDIANFNGNIEAIRSLHQGADLTYASGRNEIPTVYIQSYYYGPVYDIGLPVGAVLAVPFHNVGATWLLKLANVGIRTAKAGAGDAYTDRPGFNRVAVSSASSLLQRISGDEGSTWENRRITPVLSAPRLFKDPANALYCAGWRAKEYQVLVSDNDGRTWSNWRNMVLWDSGYSDADTACLRDGTLVTVARKSGSVWFRSSATDFAQTVRIGSAANAMMLTVDPQTQVLLVTDGQSTAYRSYNGGRSWAAVE